MGILGILDLLGVLALRYFTLTYPSFPFAFTFAHPFASESTVTSIPVVNFVNTELVVDALALKFKYESVATCTYFVVVVGFATGAGVLALLGVLTVLDLLGALARRYFALTYPSFPFAFTLAHPFASESTVTSIPVVNFINTEPVVDALDLKFKYE